MSQSDRELLELAAKAAGIDIIWFEPTDGDDREPWCYIPHAKPPHNRRVGDIQNGELWNPLTDDGDALRLAVKVLNWPHGGRAFDDQVTAMFAVGKMPSDPYEATRRAIVRAAAAIGRAMP